MTILYFLIISECTFLLYENILSYYIRICFLIIPEYTFLFYQEVKIFKNKFDLVIHQVMLKMKIKVILFGKRPWTEVQHNKMKRNDYGRCYRRLIDAFRQDFRQLISSAASCNHVNPSRTLFIIISIIWATATLTLHSYSYILDSAIQRKYILSNFNQSSSKVLKDH